MASTLTASTLESQLQTRLRIGANEYAISDANLFSIMNYTQRTLNYIFAWDVSSGTLTGCSATVIFDIDSTKGATDCYAILDIYESTRTLMKVPNWNQLQQYDSSWQLSTAARSEAWAPIGRNMAAVYPASTVSYTITYIKESTTIDANTEVLTSLPNEEVTLFLDLNELIWLAHLRLYPEAIDMVERLSRDIAAKQGGLV